MQTRNFNVDVLRVLACLLVMWQHASEFFYIGEGGSVIRNANVYAIAWLNSFSTSAVPMFVLISGYFLLPVQEPTSQFLRKRASRVLYPFIFWCIAYAIYNIFARNDSVPTALLNIAKIPVNYGTEVGHLWFVYMLLGLYLLAPVVSPWLQKCSKRELQMYLCLWVITTLLTYIHKIQPEIWGESYWNNIPTFYYFTGFAGLFVLGHYLRRYGPPPMLLGIVFVALGYFITARVFQSRISFAPTIADLELSWRYGSINVAMLTLGIFTIVSRLKLNFGQSKIGKLLTDISVVSYAMYLSHIMLMIPFFTLITKFTTNVFIVVPTLAVSTFICSYILVKLLKFLPKSKIWLGA